MKFTDTQLAQYMSGDLRLKTNRKTGEHTLVKPRAGTPDKGVTTPERRAYYRVWYLKNRKKRMKHNRKYKLRVKNDMLNAKKAVKPSEYSLRAEYHAAYRDKNRAKLSEKARKMYHEARKKAGIPTRNYSKHAPKLLKWATDAPAPVKKTEKGVLRRLFDSMFSF